MLALLIVILLLKDCQLEGHFRNYSISPQINFEKLLTSIRALACSGPFRSHKLAYELLRLYMIQSHTDDTICKGSL